MKNQNLVSKLAEHTSKIILHRFKETWHYLPLLYRNTNLCTYRLSYTSKLFISRTNNLNAQINREKGEFEKTVYRRCSNEEVTAAYLAGTLVGTLPREIPESRWVLPGHPSETHVAENLPVPFPWSNSPRSLRNCQSRAIFLRSITFHTSNQDYERINARREKRANRLIQTYQYIAYKSVSKIHSHEFNHACKDAQRYIISKTTRRNKQL